MPIPYSIFVLFYLLSFIGLVILPSILIPVLVLRFVKPKGDLLPLIFFFCSSLIILAILANILWEALLFNKVYYEWDRLILPYTLFTYEAPVLGGSINWIAPGWQLWHLYFIWLVTTVLICIVSIVVASFISKKFEYDKSQLKILFYSAVLLITIGIFGNKLFPHLFLYIMHFINPPIPPIKI